MTTNSDQIPEREETWRPVTPIDGCTFSGYQASDKGAFRSLNRVISGRQYKGQDLKTRPHEDGYRLITIRCDNTAPEHKDKRAHTFAAHKVVLCTFAGPPGPGQEACHSDRGPAFNWWPEGVRWDTRAANHADMVTAGTVFIPEPAFDCRNAPACGNKVRNEGRRCLECVRRAGRGAAGMLRDGRSLAEVAAHFGNGPDWIYRLAVEHGGYEGTKEEAQRRPVILAEEVNSAAASMSPADRDRLLDAMDAVRDAYRPRRRGWLQRVFTFRHPRTR